MRLSMLLLLTALAPTAECAGHTAYKAKGDTGDDGTKIVGGVPSEGLWPDAVYVQMVDNGEPAGGCTGTLIASDVVLTAGHCVLKSNNTYYDSIVVKAGVSHLDDPGEIATSTRMVAYPGFI